MTVREFETSDLLVGIDGYIAANDSNVRGVFDDLIARQLYLGVKAHFTDFGTVSGPWPLGPDAGKLDGPLYTVQIGYGMR